MKQILILSFTILTAHSCFDVSGKRKGRGDGGNNNIQGAAPLTTAQKAVFDQIETDMAVGPDASFLRLPAQSEFFRYKINYEKKQYVEFKIKDPGQDIAIDQTNDTQITCRFSYKEAKVVEISPTSDTPSSAELKVKKTLTPTNPLYVYSGDRDAQDACNEAIIKKEFVTENIYQDNDNAYNNLSKNFKALKGLVQEQIFDVREKCEKGENLGIYTCLSVVVKHAEVLIGKNEEYKAYIINLETRLKGDKGEFTKKNSYQFSFRKVGFSNKGLFAAESGFLVTPSNDQFNFSGLIRSYWNQVDTTTDNPK